MAVLPILKYPNSFLKQDTVKQVNPEVPETIKELISSMKETLEKTKGKGLAATQVGEDYSIILVSKSSYMGDNVIITMINPEIIETSPALKDSYEGCLSIPGIYGFVKRHEWVKVKYLDEEGKEHKITATGSFAYVIQHEDDHLKGILFIDKMSKKEYKKASKLLKKLEKFYGQGN